MISPVAIKSKPSQLPAPQGLASPFLCRQPVFVPASYRLLGLLIGPGALVTPAFLMPLAWFSAQHTALPSAGAVAVLGPRRDTAKHPLDPQLRAGFEPLPPRPLDSPAQSHHSPAFYKMHGNQTLLALIMLDHPVQGH